VIADVDDELVHRDATGDRKTSPDADGGAPGCRARHTVGVAEGTRASVVSPSCGA
jgi:hypothetical protein